MPRSVYKPPFYRRILPWVFTAVFATLAPSLIFYTSGYRINPKKVTIERNGTLIADSVPTGARIILNGEATKYVTPASLLNVAPGPYVIRYELEGHLSWEKTLDIHAEQATFADRVRLWVDSTIHSLSMDAAVSLVANEDGTRLAALLPRTDGLGVRILDSEGAILLERTVTGMQGTVRPDIRWNEAGTIILLDDPDPRHGDAWLNIGTGENGILPVGSYRFDGSTLVGIDGATRITFDPRRGTSSRERLDAGVADVTDAFDLLRHATTGDMSIRPHSLLRRQYALPRGDWAVDGTAGTYTLLRQGTTWLAVKRNGEPLPGTAAGHRPMWNFAGKNPRALLLNGNEIWMWTPGEDPQLLMRQSEPFVSVAWHQGGYDIFVATKTRAYALELDDRGGRRMTDLVTGFEDIKTMAVVGKNMLISGTRNGTAGTFIRELE